MTFISYAQNYEDVMLWRAFKDIKKGFYIDVGANDPVIDSVTKAFYDVGWHGINIEPISEWFDKLQEARPNDINLKLACGASKSQNTIYGVVGTGLSTMDKSIASKHANELDFEIKEEEIKIDSLTNICKQHSNQDIHFLKIDVEGFELQVLKGVDFEVIRPWIILVESTLPLSQIENYKEWERVLTNSGYHFIYFDGINRYYIANEHGELDDSFNTPPNYFDFFRRGSEQLIIEKLSEKSAAVDLVKVELNTARKKLSEKSAAVDLVKVELKAHKQNICYLNQELRSVYSSKSWRITWPLRKLIQFTKRLVRYFLMGLMTYVLKRPSLKLRFRNLLRKYPKVEARLHRLVIAQNPTLQKAVQLPESEVQIETLSQLTPSTQRIYHELKAANDKFSKQDI